MKHTCRPLDILFLLYSGQSMTIDDLTERYSVTERTIFRDIKVIRDTLSNYENDQVSISLDLDNTDKQYKLSIKRHSDLSLAEVTGVSKILLTSRAFSTKEINQLVEKLTDKLTQTEQKICHQLIDDELTHYIPLTHQIDIMPLVSQFIHYIYNDVIISFDYHRSDGKNIEGSGQPVSLFFSEFYFYSMFYSQKRAKHLSRRLDRFNSIKQVKKGKHNPQATLNDSEYRKKTHYMFSSDKEQVIVFKYMGYPEVVLDRFPQAIIKKNRLHDYTTFEVRAFDNGMMRWVLSQGALVEVISPVSFKQKIINEINNMYQQYH